MPEPLPGDETVLYGALTVYRERGHYLRRLEQFNRAKAAYEVAFKTAPEDVNNLIGHSRVCDSNVQPEEAYADAELALQLQPNNMTARHVQARALYTMSEFEKSIVNNYRGLRLRKQPRYFKDGVIQGLETIQHCIGEYAGNVLLDYLPLIKENETRKSILLEKDKLKSRHNCRIPQLQKGNTLTQSEQRKRVVLARVLAMKYLGPMAYDKFFLEKLVKDSRIKSANVIGSDTIQEIAHQALNSLIDRQEMLRTQRPYYNVKLAEKTASKHQTKFLHEMLKRERIQSAHISERQLKAIEKSLKENRVAEVISKAERFQIFLDTKSHKVLPDKDAYIDRLYRAVGEAYLSQHRISYRQSDKSTRRRIAFLMGLPVGRPSSFDSVVANYPFKFANIRLAIQKVKKSLDLCENSYMRCWLTYELSRLLSWQKNLTLSKFYAKRCQREAQHISSVTWWLNACFILMSSDMQQGNVTEVKFQVEEAHAWSKKMQDPEQVQAFLDKCAQLAGEVCLHSAKLATLKREKGILAVMDEKEKIETQVLFKRMATVPEDRRLPLIATRPQGHDNKIVRTKLKQKGLTIIPGPPKALTPFSGTGIPGYLRFNF